MQQAFPDATFIRPAVMFGPDDAFLTRLVRLIRILPVYPLFGTGKTRLQPVYVEDVAEAISRVLEDRGQARASHYEFGGPRIYTYEELIRKIAGQINARTRLVPMPFVLWRALAWVSEFLPGAPLTRNQIALMQRDNVASGSLPGLSSLGIAPTTIEDVVPAVEGRGPGY